MGGTSFARWLEVCAAAATRGRWASEQRRMQGLDNDGGIDRALQGQFIKDEATKWHMHMLMTLSCRGPRVNKQLFYITLACRARGMSRRGTDMLGAWSVGLSSSSYDREMAFELARAAQKARYKILSS